MIRAYIFDLYGTLVDIRTDETAPSLWKRMALLLSLQGAPYDGEELHRAYVSALREQISRRGSSLPGVIKEHIEPDFLLVLETLYANKAVSAEAQMLADTALFFRTLSLRHLRLYPHVQKVLTTLKSRGKGVYLLSNAQAAFTMPELKQLGLVPLFDGIVLSSDAGIKKPDKALFEQLMSTYELRPEECVMVGNDGIADIWGAHALGMAGRYFHTAQSPDRPDALPPSCKEIKSLLELL